MSPTKAWELVKVISGGQTGADQGGLAAARWLHYETGGYAVKGFMTEDGPAPWLGVEYHLIELPVTDKRSRTLKNVKVADATVIFSRTPLTGGTDYTQQLCEAHNKPHKINPTIEELREWIVGEQIRILNVAGPRESKQPGIFKLVADLLKEGLLPF